MHKEQSIKNLDCNCQTRLSLYQAWWWSVNQDQNGEAEKWRQGPGSTQEGVEEEAAEVHEAVGENVRRQRGVLQLEQGEPGANRGP